MALDVLITTDRLSGDPVGREFIGHLRADAQRLGLGDAILYYDFPTYSDYETVSHKPDTLLLSRNHGIIALRFVDGNDSKNIADQILGQIDESLGQFCSILIGRLLKSRSLRRDRSTILFPVTPLVFVTVARAVELPQIDSNWATSLQGFDKFLDES